MASPISSDSKVKTEPSRFEHPSSGTTTAGGGGWGDPLLRKPEAVAHDVRNEKISLASAREQYGVVLDEDTLAVDEVATETLRRRMGNET